MWVFYFNSVVKLKSVKVFVEVLHVLVCCSTIRHVTVDMWDRQQKKTVFVEIHIWCCSIRGRVISAARPRGKSPTFTYTNKQYRVKQKKIY